MKRFFVFLLSCAALTAAPRAARTGADLSRTVYVMAMGSGLDQFLANHLAQTPAIEIVTDPKLADSVLTDRIGQFFERRMDEWFPALQPGEEPEQAEEDESAVAALAAKAPPVGIMSSFGRGKGNVFLVDTRSRRVIWSTYEKPASNDARELDRVAARIAGKLGKHVMHAPKPAAAPQLKPAAAPKPPDPEKQPAQPKAAAPEKQSAPAAKPAAPEAKPAPAAKSAAPQAQPAAAPKPAAPQTQPVAAPKPAAAQAQPAPAAPKAPAPQTQPVAQPAPAPAATR